MWYTIISSCTARRLGRKERGICIFRRVEATFLLTLYNVRKIKLEGDPPGGSMAVQHNVAEVTPPNKLSIPHNQTFDNTNIDKNASVDLGAVHSAVASSYSNVQARYRLDCVEEYGGISFARADVD